MKRSIKFVVLCGLGIMGGGLTGCRDREAVEAYPYVMRSGEVVLLPTTTSLRDPKILEGTAQVVALEDRPATPSPVAETAPADGASTAPADAVSEITKMIEERNALAREKKTDELIDFIHPKFQPLAEALVPLQKAFQELVAAIETKTPGAAAALGPIASQMDSMSQEVTVTNITMNGDTAATGSMSLAGLPMAVPVNFEKLENDWYFSAANMPQNINIEAAKPKIDEVVKEFQAITGGINDGSVPAPQATGRIMTALMKLGSIFGVTNPPAVETPPVEAPPQGG